jgi:excisionase family DNA binding protein
MIDGQGCERVGCAGNLTGEREIVVDPVGQVSSPGLGRLLVSPDEAAQMLKIGRSKIYELLYEGAISSLRIGTSRRIRVVDLEAFIDDRVRQGP